MEAGVIVEEYFNNMACLKQAKKWIAEVMNNLEYRLSDKVSQLCELRKVIKVMLDIPIF